jgi:hypothetical protein
MFFFAMPMLVKLGGNILLYALIRSSTEHKLLMYLTSSIIIKRHKHQIFWDQLARRAANNLLIKYKYSPYKHHT